jgi:hypothetical protein
MILRSVTQHVRDQNWFAVALDFLIVVIGVFVGLQVQQWAQARATYEQQAIYINRLEADFEAIGRRLDEHFVIYDSSRKGSRFILDLILENKHTGEAPDQDRQELGRAVSSIGAYRVPPGRSATYAEMLSQGDLSGIGNEQLRDALADYDRIADLHRNSFDDTVDRQNLHAMILFRHQLSRSVEDSTLQSGVRSEVMSVDLDGMLNDEDYALALGINHHDANNMLALRRIQKDAVDRVLSAIRNESTK